jgi:hypothetical protein
MALTRPKVTARASGSHRRDPANDLYDRACDVVAAAAALRDAAAHENNDAAIAATLGCLEAALGDAATAIEQLRGSSARRISSAWPILGDQARTDADRAEDQFAAASAAIRAASSACGEVRGTVGPLLAKRSSQAG